jgi:hypothetical protein
VRRNVNRSSYSDRDDTPAEPGDERGTWSRSRLERMDRRFVERLERAIAAGREHPDGAERK